MTLIHKEKRDHKGDEDASIKVNFANIHQRKTDGEATWI